MCKLTCRVVLNLLHFTVFPTLTVYKWNQMDPFGPAHLVPCVCRQRYSLARVNLDPYKRNLERQSMKSMLRTAFILLALKS